jgi:rhamnose transport system permease protein
MSSSTLAMPSSTRSRLWSALASLPMPELIAAVLLAIAFSIAGAIVPGFLDGNYLLARSTIDMEAALLAITMTFVIGAGHIDLSVASILVLTSAVVARLHGAAPGVPMTVLVILAPVFGGILGLFNGVLVTRFNLPSLIVTLATMASFRGLAQVLIGDASARAPKLFVGFDNMLLADTIPMPVVVFLGAAVVLSLVLHKTVFGRYVLAMGTSPDAALYSGVPVTRATNGIFVLSGMASGIAAMMMFSRYGTVEWVHAQGMELDVVTAVVLGGASVFGGRATVIGSALALVLIFVIHAALDLSDISGPVQNGAVGALLIIAVLLSNGVLRLQGRRAD